MFRNPLTDALIVLLIVLLIFGPKRLPTLGRSLGEGFREFKDSITGGSKDGEAEERPAISPGSSTSATGVSGEPAANRVAEPANTSAAEGSTDRASTSAEVGSGPAPS
jgi:sec-independent protein translocase protein TatA